MSELHKSLLLNEQVFRWSIFLYHHWAAALTILRQSASNWMKQPLTFVSWLPSSLRLCVREGGRGMNARVDTHVTASFLSAGSILGITHSISIDGKHGLGLWQAGRVVDFTDPRFSSTFPQVQTINVRPVLTNLEWWNCDVMTFSVSTLLVPCLSTSTNEQLLTHRVVDAWARMLPPIGFLGSAENMAAPSTCATTWLVITTATPNCCDIRLSQIQVLGVRHCSLNHLCCIMYGLCSFQNMEKPVSKTCRGTHSIVYSHIAMKVSRLL